jgi:hypothetical protein
MSGQYSFSFGEKPQAAGALKRTNESNNQAYGAHKVRIIQYQEERLKFKKHSPICPEANPPN